MSFFSFFKKKKHPTPIAAEKKSCGHNCELYIPDSCCQCGDNRPKRAQYEKYVDGTGWVKSVSRHAFYCPTCKKRCDSTPTIDSTSNSKRHTHSPSSNTSSSNNNNREYSKNNPYCPHSIYPTRCMICGESPFLHMVSSILPPKSSHNPRVNNPPPVNQSNDNSTTRSNSSTTRSEESFFKYKQCGHHDCQLDCNDTCCQCGDKRPLQNFYEEYIDGKGYIQSASRHAFYCPGCSNRISRGGNVRIPSNLANYTKTNPYCPHSVYPTNCALCTEKSAIEQRAVKDAVRLGFAMTEVTKASRSIPNKESIKTAEEYLQAILDILEREQNEKEQATIQRSVTNPVISQIPPVSNPYQPNPYYYAPSAFVPMPNPQASQPPFVVQPSAPPMQPADMPHSQPIHPPKPEIHAEPANNEALDDDCKVCFEATVNCVLIPCGHLALCYSCAVQITKTSKKCPICRMDVMSVVQTFKA